MDLAGYVKVSVGSVQAAGELRIDDREVAIGLKRAG